MFRPRLALPLALAAALVALPAAPARAQSRSDRQMMADIRMLQEQAQQIQAALASLNDVLKTLNGRLDAQQDQIRKGFADQRVQTDQFGSDLRIVRERVDETNVRITSLSQEVEALRLAVPMTAAPPTTPEGEAVPGTSPAPAPVPSAAGLSPQRLYDTAWADYAAGQWTLAIEGFQNYIRTFPKSDLADDAQFYVGETYYQDSKFNEAITAYTQVISNYPNSNKLPGAYYKRGLAYDRLSQVDRARESFEYAAKTFPDTDEGRLAKQSLDRLGRPKP